MTAAPAPRPAPSTLDMASPGRAPLDPQRRVMVCALNALLNEWLALGGRSAARTLMTLVGADLATTDATPAGHLTLTMLGIRAETDAASTTALLRAWQTVARDRLAQEARL